MYNEMFDAVVGRLKELFGEDCTIHTGPADQGIKGPCIFVQFLESAEKPMIGPRYFRKMGFLIQYQPQETPQNQRELNQAAEILMDGMEYITMGDGSRLRGTGRSARHDLEKGLMAFQVSYNLYVIKAGQAETLMETIEIEKGMVK